MSDVLSPFLPVVQAWFRETFGEPTPPQVLGWPAIQRGDHTLILSPTGSGKTLAAFLWGIDELYRAKLEGEQRTLERDASAAARPAARRAPARRRPASAGDEPERGVRLLYISPLKALNNDVERNLRLPLAGIRRVAKDMDAPLPPLTVMVRTGDTPQAMRQQMVKQPPDILITTPESLYLILTSPVARDMFRTVRTVIVDEIHTLVGNKRGVHLAVSLERVVELAGPSSGAHLQRIGLSATQRPLDEVARFLGGYEQGQPRPVTIVDAGMVKPLDLQVVTAVDDFAELPGGSIWPAVIPQVMDLIERHRTTLVFANSRRQAERAADRLNELYVARRAGQPGGPEALMEGGAVKGRGFQGTGVVGGPFRAHHGSVSKESRLELERALKDGRLPALVGTSSLELGIDIGSVDLVVQLQSPHSITQGLQRVGRSGHLVGQTSKGRVYATHREDLLEAAAITRAMLAGDVEPAYTPQNSLDVLAQQIVAMVAVQDWDVPALFDVLRRAYPYHALTPDLFHGVLDMLSGRYPGTAYRELRPRLAWDRVHDQLAALPGSRLLAVRNGGTIPDRGSFGAYLADRKTRLGELDEEFVYETQPGDVFTLGASTWRVLEVTEDRVIVSPAPGHLPRMPFWRGETARRDYHLGKIYGAFRRELAERIATQPEDDVVRWLQEEHRLDLSSARNAVGYVRHQVEVLGAISSDRTVIAEMFADAVGDLRLVIHSCFGARVNSPWALALAHALREALGSQPEVQVNDDGILFRFLEADRDPPLDLVTKMGPAETRERLLAELPSSALFGAQFRVNAARALLLPPAKGGQKRTPFWLQRLRAKDLLTAVQSFRDFPIVAETYRDCLRDVLDLAHTEEVLRAIQAGDIQVVTVETLVPSPVAASLLFDFVAQYMYEWDLPKAERQMQALLLGRDVLAQLLDDDSLPDLLRPEAVRAVDDQLQHRADGTRARTPDELTTLFLALGDLSAAEAAERSDGDGAAWLHQLAAAGRLVPLPGALAARYVLPEQVTLYLAAFNPASPEQDADDARRAILRRTLSTHGPLPLPALLARYPWPAGWLDAALIALVDSGEVVVGDITPEGGERPEVCDRRNLERIHRATLGLLRAEVEPVPLAAYADFLARWQHLHPAERLAGPGSLTRVLQQLRGAPLPGVTWERDVLPLRLAEFHPDELEALCQGGDLVWVGSGGRDPRRLQVRFLFRGEGHLFLPSAAAEPDLSPSAAAVLAFLKTEGACFLADLQDGTDLRGEALNAALVELVAAGLVTNDSLQALRQVLAWSDDSATATRRPLTALEAELAAWREARGPAPVRRLAHGRISARDRQAVAGRVSAATAPAAAGPAAQGRWSMVHRIGVWGKEEPFEEQLARQARQILHCFGIVSQKNLEEWKTSRLEEGTEEAWDWGTLYRQLQLMEMRGEVRRGYFVQGLPGVQFALPEAVERLREWTTPDTAAGAGDLVLLNACDPANLFGRALPLAGTEPDPGTPAEVPPGQPEQREPEAGPEAEVPPEAGRDPARFMRIPANYVVLLRGRPVLLLELGAGRLTALPGLPPDTLERALRLVVDHVGQAQRRFALNAWGDEPILDSPVAPLLERLGFRREALLYIWEGS